MFCEYGYLPIGKALSEWQEVFDTKIERDFAEDLLADDHYGPTAIDDFEAYEKYDGPKAHHENVIDYLRWNIRETAKNESLELFFYYLEMEELFIFDGTKTLRAAPELLARIDFASFHEEFWDQDLNEINERTINISTVRSYLKLPDFCGGVLFFIDPYSWTVDPRAIEVIRERVSQVIDPLRLQAWIDREGMDEETGDYLGTWEKVQELIDHGIVPNHDDNTISYASPDQFDYFLEYTIPLLKNVSFDFIQRFKGASLCIKEASWLKVIDQNKSKTFRELRHMRTSELKSVGSVVDSTIAEERRAVVRVSEFLTREKWTGTIAELRLETGIKLGPRAWRRVIDEVRKNFPEISTPGRRPKNS